MAHKSNIPTLPGVLPVGELIQGPGANLKATVVMTGQEECLLPPRFRTGLMIARGLGLGVGGMGWEWGGRVGCV